MTENPIKNYCETHDISLAALARSVGINKSVLTHVGTRKQSTSLNTAMKIKRATGGKVTADALGEFLFPQSVNDADTQPVKEK